MPGPDDLSPIRIEVPEDELEDLRARLDHTRWPGGLTSGGWGRGVPEAYLRSLVGDVRAFFRAHR